MWCVCANLVHVETQCCAAYKHQLRWEITHVLIIFCNQQLQSNIGICQSHICYWLLANFNRSIHNVLGCYSGVNWALFTLLYSEMDAHQSSICTAITKVLPDLPASILDILEETLQSLGVETTEYFQFIQEADLLSVLRPIQTRKLLAAWKQTSKYISTKLIFK